jgi:sugar-specific transcriptional regulator TrmB
MQKEQLLKIGLTETEATVYLALLENNRLSPNGIHRLTGIKRTTIYAAADELVKKGIIQKDDSKKTIYYVAGSPKDLKNIIAKEKRALLEKENSIDELIPELEQLPKTRHFTIPKVQTIAEADIDDFMYRRAPIWKQSMIDTGETTWWGIRDGSVMQLEKQLKFVKWFWETAPKSIDLKVFGADTPEEKSAEDKLTSHVPSRRIVRNIGGDPFTANQWIAGEYIINYVTAQKPNYMVEIRDRLLADNLRSLYRRLWEKTEE